MQWIWVRDGWMAERLIFVAMLWSWYAVGVEDAKGCVQLSGQPLGQNCERSVQSHCGIAVSLTFQQGGGDEMMYGVLHHSGCGSRNSYGVLR